MVFRMEDMPYSINGIVPDLIINPHAIPSRMTIGHLIECIAGKYALLAGDFVDGTIFSGVSAENLQEALLKQGFQSHGNEALFNPYNGEMFQS